MADYEAFERDYPTLSKFVGAAREAAAVMPGATSLTPAGQLGSAQQQQGYNDARQRFQQTDPMAAAAGRAVGYGVDLAALSAGLGGLGRYAAAQGARQAAQSAAAGASSAMPGTASNFAPQLAQAMAARAPRFVAPTPGNVMVGARQAYDAARPLASAAAPYAGYVPAAGLLATPFIGASQSRPAAQPGATPQLPTFAQAAQQDRYMRQSDAAPSAAAEPQEASSIRVHHGNTGQTYVYRRNADGWYDPPPPPLTKPQADVMRAQLTGQYNVAARRAGINPLDTLAAQMGAKYRELMEYAVAHPQDLAAQKLADDYAKQLGPFSRLRGRYNTAEQVINVASPEDENGQ